MREREFIIETVATNPFKNSQTQNVVWHATDETFKTFNRPGQGVFVSRYKGYAEAYYGTAIPLYIDVRNIFVDSEYDHPAIDAAFDMDYDTLTTEIAKLKQQGYDAIAMGGDGDSLILFDNVKIVNAKTGEQM